ncbi:hypothetical protein GCM10010430_55450 [Kitasatospora cystarginea]|uniref:Uncharacterized protein n=1 Tax=Kitasatospora cystarginea TaxID=58350 RepID=A0ABN3EN64_9ACTN
MTATRDPGNVPPGPLGLLRRAVLYRCTSHVHVNGIKQTKVLDWGVLPTVKATHQLLRRVAAGVSQTLPDNAGDELRAWLRDPEALTVLARTLDEGGVYELELCGAGVRTVLAAHHIIQLPLLSRGRGYCPAVMLHGRRLWARKKVATAD